MGKDTHHLPRIAVLELYPNRTTCTAAKPLHGLSIKVEPSGQTAITLRALIHPSKISAMSEGFEVPSPHERHVEHVTEHAHARGDNFAGKIAVMTAIMATVGALLSYQASSTESEAAMDKNNAAIKKTEASNQWNYYQAKSSRQNLSDLASHIPGMDAAHYLAEAERYKKEKEVARKDAEALEADSHDWDEKSERALHQHHRWAQAMTAIQIAISLAAITLLTRKEWLKRLSYSAAAVSVVLGGLAWLQI